jgi:hypothetical protein
LILFLPLGTIPIENRYKFAELTLVQAMAASQETSFGGMSIEAVPRLVESGAEL